MYNLYINVRNVFIKHYFYFLILGVIFISLVIIVKMPEKQILEYGSWPSSLTSDKLFGGTCKAIKEIQVSGGMNNIQGPKKSALVAILAQFLKNDKFPNTD